MKNENRSESLWVVIAFAWEESWHADRNTGVAAWPVAMYKDKETAERHAELAIKYKNDMRKALEKLEDNGVDVYDEIPSLFDEYYNISPYPPDNIEYYVNECELSTKEELAVKRAQSWAEIRKVIERYKADSETKNSKK